MNESNVPPVVDMDPTSSIKNGQSVEARYRADLTRNKSVVATFQEPQPIIHTTSKPAQALQDPEIKAPTTAIVPPVVTVGTAIPHGENIDPKTLEAAINTAKSDHTSETNPPLFTAITMPDEIQTYHIPRAHIPVTPPIEVISEPIPPIEEPLVAHESPIEPEQYDNMVVIEDESESNIVPDIKPIEGSSIDPNEDEDAIEDESPTIPVIPIEDTSGPVLQGYSVEAFKKKQEAEAEQNNATYISSPKKLNDTELISIQDYTTSHYRILEGINPELARIKSKQINIADRKIITYQDTPDFDFQKLRIDKSATDGERRVQVVAVQSGYSVLVKPMKHRALSTFGRRVANEDTYAYEMAICQAIYSRLTEFSIGAMSFERFMNKTAWPDLQTLTFGLYMATFPNQNEYTITCEYCSKTIMVPIAHDSLIAIPPGSIAQEQITAILYGKSSPEDIYTASQRNSAIDIFTDNGVKFFRIKTPSIMEFLENAYHNKKDTVIESNSDDMYFAGYIRGFGILDIDRYNKSGEVNYYYDTRIETIDKALADMDSDERFKFRKNVINYINKYSISYQIPRLKCPHCSRIMRQREINMRTLFLTIRTLKGL